MSHRGLNRSTGRAITDDDHLRQSVADILMTPVGSRLMRREYGSLIPELIDQPLNADTQLRLMSATIMALLRWEPRITPLRVSLVAGDDASSVYLDLDAINNEGPRAGQRLSLSVPLGAAA